MKLICNLCELPITPPEEDVTLRESGNVYCQECWDHRYEEIMELENQDAPE